ncbi:hypothetical protein KFK09_017470 [Dendrobium nobile]|uniref:Uncharacterized protein n=1 Tax=Dendrobium nobile TaxID=94219 RepID=A0A8T3B2B2_DENNO|nr:hypothetical protein KFK09_017470 [Dendrobium nobile]
MKNSNETAYENLAQIDHKNSSRHKTIKCLFSFIWSGVICEKFLNDEALQSLPSRNLHKTKQQKSQYKTIRKTL